MKKFLFLFIPVFGIQQLNAQLAVTLNHTNVSCNGGCNGTATAVASGGTPPYTYAWNPVNSGNPITGLCVGNYTVTVTDGLANVASATCTITQPLALTISFSSTAITCNSGTGNVTANISGGVPPYNYNWVPGNYSFATITNVSTGSYTCTVTDGNACTVTGTYVLTQPSAITSSISPTNSSPCVGSSVSFTPNVTGGTLPYTYSWTFPGGSPSTSTSQTPSVVWGAAGTYTVTLNITDANGCTSSATTTITPDSPTITITPSYPTICAGSSLTMTGSGA
ncbi:MAG TPA: PKD domain-containing protein, partial [Bacteroidia bacterium]|nr:PKD domain-containing protein [Bacteroidia bacterium]